MTVFALGEEPFFPDPCFAEPDGLLAVGGDLRVERLVMAYASGIFPWYNLDTPILWWSPDPRPIIYLDDIHIAKSLAKQVRKRRFEISLDRAFEEVIGHCAKVKRTSGCGTWLVNEMIEAYIDLHEAGFAHSVEAWLDGRLVGGLYGVSLGKAFFGESMFFLESGASRVAFVHLAGLLKGWGFHFVDCQQATPHMMAFGGVEISRERFLEELSDSVSLIGSTENGVSYGQRGIWSMPEGFNPLEELLT